MSSKLTLFFGKASPPARACLLLARLLELNIEVKQVNLGAGEQHSEEFLKLNPINKIPVLVDGDFVLSESRAILSYLVNSKKPGSDLYPTDIKTRALIDQRLYFDATEFAVKLQELIRPGVYDGAKQTTQKQRDAIRAGLKTLDNLLNGQEYLVGTHLTIADISVLPSVTSIDAMGYNLADYEHLSRWFKKLSDLPGFEENLDGAKFHAEIARNIYENSLF